MAALSDRVSLRAVVSGRVQGVCYRAFVEGEATGLGLRGRVRNLPDGRVEVVAEGERKRLDQLLNRLRRGPSHAFVSDVKAEWEEYRHEYDDFQIDYS